MGWRGTAACLAVAMVGTAGFAGSTPAAAAAPVTAVLTVAASETAVPTVAATATPAGRTAGVTATAAGRNAGVTATAAVRTAGSPLNVRDNASTWNAPVGQLANGAAVRARCQIGGETVTGTVRTSSMWLHLGDGRFVSDGYVRWSPRRPSLAWCDQPADPAPTTQSKFIRWAARQAAASRREYRVPVSVSIAQAINESGWGRSSLTKQGNAYFGIKCFGIPGPIAAGCRPYNTSECDRTGCGPTTATFRVYRSASRSFLDHGRFLTVNPRYQPAFKHTDNPDRFAREIHKAGYATDPRYSDKLIGLMRQFNLYRFDG